MRVCVLGCGRWGTFLAWYANRIGHQVIIWGREGSRNYEALYDNRENEYLHLPETINMTNSLEGAIRDSELVIISISAQNLRSFTKQIKAIDNLSNKIFVLCMKGLEIGSGKRLTQVFREEIGHDVPVGIWVGPGHVQDYVRNIPNCMVIGSDNIDVTKRIVSEMGSELIRFYYGQDMIGNEVGAAAKNVMGIAAGMLDGFGYSSLKGALMARGTREVSRLVRAMGGNELTVYGLSHLGDYEATLFSEHSNNRRFGMSFVTTKDFEKLAEGAATAKALKELSKAYEVELPICNTVNEILDGNREAKEALLNLFMRPIKFEF